MIPLALVLAGLNLATKALEAFIVLDPDTRKRLVNDFLEDKDARDAAWKRFTIWISGLFGKIKL